MSGREDFSGILEPRHLRISGSAFSKTALEITIDQN
jgi:hypothetical protein